MKSCSTLATLLLPLSLLTGCGGSDAQKADDASTANSTATPTATIKSAMATLGTAQDELTVYGVTEAGPGGQQSVIAMREAILVSILAPTGTAVAAGQSIAILRPSPTAALERAKAASDATVANAALARAMRLRADGLVSDADVETARAAVRAATATRTATASGSNVLRAPIAGTVQGLNARPGDQIAAGILVASIAATGEHRARFGIDPATASRVRAGQVITIAAIGGGATLTAPVVGVDPAVDATTRLASVFTTLPATFAVGAPLRGHISIGRSSSGVTIPYAALLDDNGQSFVFIVEKGVVKKRAVLPGSSSGDRVTVTSGLRQGERVVTEGGTALEDGMKVREEGPAANAPASHVPTLHAHAS